MFVRRFIAVWGLVIAALFGVIGCSLSGPGATSECDVSGCTVTFQRGVDAQVSVLGLEARLTAVQGDMVTMTLAGHEVSVPLGSTEQAEGLDLTVQEITETQVVVRLSTGLQ